MPRWALLGRDAASMRVCSFMVFSPALAAGSMPRRGARFHHFFGLVGQGAGAPASAYRPPGAPSTSPAIAAKAEKKKRGEKRAHRSEERRVGKERRARQWA